MSGQYISPIAAGAIGPVINPQGNTFGGPFDFFFYVTSPTSISSVLTPVQSLIQLDADSQFAWIATSYQANIANAALTESTNVLPLVNVLITDGGSGKNLSNAALPLTAIAGDGKRPYRLLGPRVFQPSATINFNWTNNVAAGTAYNITLVLHGIKLYNR